MTKITAEHLARSAFVYIRQSTADQLVHNQESQRRQYGLADRARQLGWATVEVIDDDLGRSGGGINRPGFERLLAAICEGRVGAVFAIEASRLARNGRDWHTLIEFCGLVGTVIVDEDGIYDPRHPNDRLLLGMKGTMSELELSLFRQRSQEALKQKARRGALFLGVAAGYVKTGRERIEKDPDQRVQDALKLVFAKFAELQSVRQVHVWLRDEGIALARRMSQHGGGALHRLEAAALQHRAQHSDQPRLCWSLCLRAHDEQGQRRGGPQAREARSAAPIGRMGRAAQGSARRLYHLERVREEPARDCQQCDRQGRAIARGAVRRGELLLAGLLRCGHCGRKMYVGYGGKAGRYHCEGALVNHGTERCISFGGLRADHAVGTEVLRVLKPLGIDAAVKALDAQTGETSAAKRQLELALQQARFEAAHARRQYDAVDPANRLVAGELERRWNEALQACTGSKARSPRFEASKPSPLGEKERQQLMQLGADLELAWSHPAATSATRKRIVRAALSEIVVRIEGVISRWSCIGRGRSHRTEAEEEGVGKHRWTIPEDTLSLVRELARLMPDRQIARLLNRAGKPTGRGNGWTQARVARSAAITALPSIAKRMGRARRDHA